MRIVYKYAQRDVVIHTAEVLDGQQWSISICEYVNNDFSIENMLFGNLPSLSLLELGCHAFLVRRMFLLSTDGALASVMKEKPHGMLK